MLRQPAKALPAGQSGGPEDPPEPPADHLARQRSANRQLTPRARWAIFGFTALAAALRAPFMWTGLSTDEGGYAYVAQQWSRGERVYDTAWLDRPQGLLLTYRALLWLNDSGWTIRLGMVLAGILLTGLIGVIGVQLGGPRVGVLAAGIYAVVGVGPHIEGMTLNGELLASVPATAAVAAALWWRRSLRPPAKRRLRSWGWLAAAGLLAGLAITMKQSGIDGLMVGLVVVVLTPAATARAGRIGVFLGAFALPLVACALHGWSVGWSRYATALAGYQFAAIGGSGSNLHTRWTDLAGSLPDAAWDLGALVVVGAIGFRFTSRPARWILGGWLLAGAIGINLGGSYWPHYYVQALPPLVLLAAVTAGRLLPGGEVAGRFPAAGRVAAGQPAGGRVAGGRVAGGRVAGGQAGGRTLGAGLVAVLVLPTLIWLAALVPMSASQRARTIPYDALARRDDRIAAAIVAETTPDDHIYVLESEAYLYFAAQRRASYPYLWGKPIDKIPAALPRLRAMFTAPDRPTLVILDTPNPDDVDPTGAIRQALSTYYHLDRVVDGVVILRAD